MKHTGIVRRFDELGRIAVPRETRREIFGTATAEGKPVEICYENDGTIILVPYHPPYEHDNNRIKIVMDALKVELDDAIKIVKHLTEYECLDWIDNYDEKNRNNEPLVDVHYETNFVKMINWMYEGSQPFEMLGLSNNINEYPQMLELENGVIFWYGLV